MGEDAWMVSETEERGEQQQRQTARASSRGTQAAAEARSQQRRHATSSRGTQPARSWTRSTPNPLTKGGNVPCHRI